MYPVELLDEHLQLAVRKLDALQELYLGLGGEDWVDALREDVGLLRARLDRSNQEAPEGWAAFW